MKFVLKIVILIFFIGTTILAGDEDIYLIIRADDIGSSHAANIGCIKSFDEGIAQSVEIMVPCPWFLEAAKLLRERPNYDVGVHLTLTSEWEDYKWGPLTCAPSLTDSNGYFYPRQKDWVNEKAEAFWNANPDMGEVEAELRAQIEMAMKHIPRISHLTGHMGIESESVSPKMNALFQQLAQEYGLDIHPADYNVKNFSDYGKSKQQEKSADRESEFIATLKNLEPGIYLFVEHPGADGAEMQAIGHAGSNDVAKRRAEVTKIFTSPEVKRVIKQRNIKLISYKDLQTIGKN